MTHQRNEHATPGKSIYLDGIIYEGCTPAMCGAIGVDGIVYKVTNKLPCELPNPFKDGQEVVLGKDYVKQWQWTGFGDWHNCSEEEYNKSYKNHRRIIALPIQAEKREAVPKEMTPDNLTTAILLEVQQNCADNGGLLDYEKLRSSITEVLAHSQQPQQGMRWVNTKERRPTEDGYYFLKLMLAGIKVGGYFYHGYFEQKIEDAIKAGDVEWLDETPSVEPEVRDGWVKVEDRLPEINEKFGESDYVLAVEYFGGQQVVCWYSKKDGWRVAHYKADSLPIVITHWMPLPTPPQH